MDQAARSRDGQVLDLARYVPGLLTFMANKLSTSASAVYQRRFGINITTWRVLSQVAIEPGVTASRICQVIGLDKGPVSRTLARMEDDGFVVSSPDPDDARRRHVSITREGRALHDRVLAVALAREARLLSCLDPAEREALIGLLNQLHAHLPAVTEAPHRGEPA